MRSIALLLSPLATLAALFGPANSAAAQTPLEWNLRPQVAGLVQKLESGQEGRLAFVADSLGFANNSLNWFMRERFWDDYGFSGDGYMAVGKGFTGATHGPRPGISYDTSQGACYLSKDTADRNEMGAYCPDGIYAQVWADGYYHMTLYGTSCRLYYLTQPGGGILRVTLDGEVIAELPTKGPIGHAAFDFDAGGDPYTLKDLTLASADGHLVLIRGLDMRTGQPGYTQHRLARGGAGPTDFNRSDNPETAAILAGLQPDVVIIMLDWVDQVEFDAFVEETELLLDFYQQTLPSARFILMSHHPYKKLIKKEAAMLYQIAQDRDVGFINLFAAVPGGLDEMNERGFLGDGVHLTVAGGQFFGDYVYDMIRHAACPADYNADGTVDLFDFLAFQNLFQDQDPAADCEPDGMLDLFDFICFQNAFALGC